MSDFMALIASMALILGHATSHGGNERDHLLAHRRPGDRATVKIALDCIGPISELHDEVLAVRCVALLLGCVRRFEDMLQVSFRRVPRRALVPRSGCSGARFVASGRQCVHLIELNVTVEQRVRGSSPYCSTNSIPEEEDYLVGSAKNAADAKPVVRSKPVLYS